MASTLLPVCAQDIAGCWLLSPASLSFSIVRDSVLASDTSTTQHPLQCQLPLAMLVVCGVLLFSYWGTCPCLRIDYVDYPHGMFSFTASFLDLRIKAGCIME